MDVESCVPPGFRFHPTEEELVGYYLTRKVNSQNIDLGVIVEIDLYRMEPWDLQDRCKLGYEEKNEWYFFSHKDKKYPTGTRTNRATTAGFWKATGRDKIVLSKDKIIGMRKTLVFYKGRAPNGRKTDWIMHEYRLQTSEHGPPQEEVWVVCRAFKKPIPNQRPGLEPLDHSHFYTNTYEKLLCSSHQLPHQNLYDQSISIDQVTNYEAKQPHLTHLIDLPQLHSPSLTYEPSITANTIEEEPKRKRYGYESQLTDWQSLDTLFFTFNEASNSDLELLPVDCEADVRNHVNGLISSFHTT